MLACCRGDNNNNHIIIFQIQTIILRFFFKSKIRKTEKISKKTWKYVICLLKKNKIRDLH